MYVWASSCSGRNQGAVRSDHARLVLARDTTAQDASEKGAVPDSRSSSNFCTVKSYSHKQTKGCHGSRHNRGASSKRATCRGYYSCCALLLPYCSLLHYKSGFLSTWVGLLCGHVRNSKLRKFFLACFHSFIRNLHQRKFPAIWYPA